MKNLKLSGKLIVSFGLVLIMMLICAVSAIVSMNVLGTQINQYDTKTMPNTHAVWGMRRNIVSAQRNMLGAIVSSDPALMQKYLDANSKDSQDFASLLDTFSKNTRVDKAIIDTLSSNISKITPIKESIVGLLAQGDKAGAVSLYES